MPNTFVKTDGSFARVLPEANLSQPTRTLDEDVARAKAMLTQTQAEGDKPFAGSSYEKNLSATPTPVAPVTDNPYDAFNELLMGSLKKAQSINTTDLLKQQRELQRQRIAKMQGGVSATPEEARFLSPSQQSAIRGADNQSMNTAIDAVQYEIESANQTRKDLIEQILFARDSGDRARASALEAEYKKADMEYKDKQMKLEEEKLAETIRGNKASEYLAGQKTSGGGSGLTLYQQFTTTQSLAKDTQARTEKAREMIRQAGIMQTAYNNYIKGGDKNVATQAIVGTFNKVLDPTSVVREGEYDRTAKGQSLIAQIEGKARNIVEGGNITPATLKAAVDLTNEYLKGAQDNIIQQNKRAEQMAIEFGLNPDFVSSTQSNPEQSKLPKTIDDYRAEFPKATNEELQALMNEEQGTW
jgi:hypothetical protein